MTYVVLAAHPPVEAFAVAGCRARAWRRAAVPVAVASHLPAAATTEAGYRRPELDTTGKPQERVGKSRNGLCVVIWVGDRGEVYAEG